MNGLKELRDRRLLTQEQLAALSGISVATISRIETNKAKPSYKTIRLLAKGLEMPVEQVRGAVKSIQQTLLL